MTPKCRDEKSIYAKEKHMDRKINFDFDFSFSFSFWTILV